MQSCLHMAIGFLFLSTSRHIYLFLYAGAVSRVSRLCVISTGGTKYEAAYYPLQKQYGSHSHILLVFQNHTRV